MKELSNENQGPNVTIRIKRYMKMNSTSIWQHLETPDRKITTVYFSYFYLLPSIHSLLDSYELEREKEINLD